MYYYTRGLFSITKLQVYDKEKRDQVKVVLLYQSVIESNTFLFDPAVPKLGHSQVGQDQVVYTFVQVAAQ